MNSKSIVAILLIVAGVAIFAYQGITYTTREEKVNIGPLKITAEEERTIPLPPILGAVAIAGGIALLLMGRKA
jgi:hypothetical protein